VHINLSNGHICFGKNESKTRGIMLKQSYRVISNIIISKVLIKRMNFKQTLEKVKEQIRWLSGRPC
jgi:hypothetical protein